MIPIQAMSRRRILRGMMGGAAVTVGLPLLDCFLNTNGTALADGAPLPLCFGTWHAAQGFTPGFWEPKTVGPNYEMGPEIEVLTPFRDKINVFSGMKIYLDEHAHKAHADGSMVCYSGGLPPAADVAFPSLDTLISDVIGTRSRFRSLEASCNGLSASFSKRSASAINPSETSPAAMYARIFGADFTDPNATEFKPDPKVMVRRSVLSAVGETRQGFTKKLGASDRARADEYFTALRQLEQQIDLQLQKPAAMKACWVPTKAEDGSISNIVDDALATNKMFATLFAHALACGQTQVFNILFAEDTTGLRRANSGISHHTYTHEQPVDPKLGYQPDCRFFSQQGAQGYHDLVAALDGIREGDGTLLDRSLIYYSTDVGFAKFHSVDNMPLFTAGSAGGRIKTGIHVQAAGDPVTRVGLTAQQALGVPTNSWGSESNQTSKTITEVVA